MNLARLATYGVILSCLVMPAERTVAATVGTVKVALHSFTPEYRAYAQVEPRRVVTVRTAATGVIAALRVLSGEQVHAGQTLAKLTGPDYRAELIAARARRDAARSNLKISRGNYPQFSSAQDVADARAALDEAQSNLDRLRAAGRLRAPVDGIVLSVETADGERVAPGQSLVTLQPSKQLWLRAAYYGADAGAIHAGMTGEFSPADSNQPISVKVVTVFGALAPDGGESIGLLAAAPMPGWLNGQFGTVTLNGPTRQLVAVPTRALVLDRGRWWVLVHTPQGLRAQQVVPGPARGWQTFIERGLAPGAEVLAENAYLEFHRTISKNYKPPD